MCLPDSYIGFLVTVCGSLNKMPLIGPFIDMLSVDRGFCPVRSNSHLVPKKHTEVYINYKLVGLLAQAFLLTNFYILQ